MKAVLLPLLAAAALAGCASNPISDSDRLALYQTHAGKPVNQIFYNSPRGWDRVDGQHLMIDMGPRKQYLLTLTGPCLDWNNGSPFIGLDAKFGTTLSTFDEVKVPGAPMSCRITEIRPVDLKQIRAGEDALRTKAKA